MKTFQTPTPGTTARKALKPFKITTDPPAAVTNCPRNEECGMVLPELLKRKVAR